MLHNKISEVEVRHGAPSRASPELDRQTDGQPGGRLHRAFDDAGHSWQVRRTHFVDEFVV